MDKNDIEKFKRNQQLMIKALHKEKGERECVFDGYEIHDDLVTWALLNIPTKKLKEMVKSYE